MRVDVLELQAFYRTGLGAVAHQMVQRQLHSLWPDLTGLDVLGYGYATPWLDPWAQTARRVVACMPASQGVERWPSEGATRATISEEDRTPFPDAMFDRILVVHGLEEAEVARPLLRELWRILAPEGRLAVVVANRRGLWARAEATPFGQGRPYSRSQLAALLSDAMFQPVAWSRAIYVPPLQLRLCYGAAEAWEAAGARIWPAFSGVLMVEAVKRLYAGSVPGKTGRVLLAQPAVARFAGSQRAGEPKNWAFRPAAGATDIPVAQAPVPALQGSVEQDETGAWPVAPGPSHSGSTGGLNA